MVFFKVLSCNLFIALVKFLGMGSSNIRDILTSFSPSLDFFAISTGDGRIKV